MQLTYDYNPPLDNLALLRESELTIPAHELQPGDIVVARGFISFAVTAVRLDVPGFAVAEYEFSGAAGTRVFADTQTITVRRLPAGSH